MIWRLRGRSNSVDKSQGHLRGRNKSVVITYWHRGENLNQSFHAPCTLAIRWSRSHYARITPVNYAELRYACPVCITSYLRSHYAFFFFFTPPICCYSSSTAWPHASSVCWRLADDDCYSRSDRDVLQLQERVIEMHRWLCKMDAVYRVLQRQHSQNVKCERTEIVASMSTGVSDSTSTVYVSALTK